MAGAGELRIEEADVEGRVVDDQAAVAEKVDELLGDRREERLVGTGSDRDRPWTAKAPAATAPLGVDVGVIAAPGRKVVEELDAADLDHPVAGRRIGPGRFGIEDDLAQHRSDLRSGPRVAQDAAGPSRKSSQDRPDLRFGRGKAAARVHKEMGPSPLFGVRHLPAPGSPRACAALMPGRARTRARCTSAGAVTTRTASQRASPPVSKRSGMSRTTSGGPAAAARLRNATSSSRDERMNDRFEAASAAVGIAEHHGAERRRGRRRPLAPNPGKAASIAERRPGRDRGGAPPDRHRGPARRAGGRSRRSRTCPCRSIR